MNHNNDDKNVIYGNYIITIGTVPYSAENKRKCPICNAMASFKNSLLSKMILTKAIIKYIKENQDLCLINGIEVFDKDIKIKGPVYKGRAVRILLYKAQVKNILQLVDYIRIAFKQQTAHIEDLKTGECFELNKSNLIKDAKLWNTGSDKFVVYSKQQA